MRTRRHVACTVHTPCRMLLAPFGESFAHATASNLAPTPLHPDLLSPGQKSNVNITAIVLHGAVYGAREDVGCVLHTHSPHATALAASDLRFEPELIQVRCAQDKASGPRASSLRHRCVPA